jgi:small subunit ribosomal protein S6
MLLLDSNKYSNDPTGVVNQIHGILEKHHAEVLASRPWDERRLAYSIGHHKKGMYYLIYFKAEGKNLVPIEHDFGLNEPILRTMILKIHRKLVDAMLAVARDEHAVAIQTPGLADEGPEAPVGVRAGAEEVAE